MRLAPTRLVPFSYFCTCWKVKPSASPSFSWLMPSMIRRMRTRLPTYLSTGLGALVDIANTPRDHVCEMKQNGSEVCLRRRYRQSLAGGSVRKRCEQFEQYTGGLFLSNLVAQECEWRSVCQLVDSCRV